MFTISTFIKSILRSRLHSQSGGSLIQVMVISGMVGVFSLAVINTQQNVKQMRTTLSIRDANNQLRASIINLLKYPSACMQNFDTLTASTIKTGSAADPVLSLKDTTNTDRYVPASGGSPTYFGRARIASMTFGQYEATKDLAVLNLTTSNSDRSPTGSGFNVLNLGGNTSTYPIAVRVFFNGDGTMLSCQAEDRHPDEILADATGASDSILARVCGDDIGGSFHNGRCIMADYVGEAARSMDGTNATNWQNICQNLGGQFNTTTKTCSPGLMNGSSEFCPNGEALYGFNDTTGAPICGAPPP